MSWLGEGVEAPGASVPLSLEPILVDMEGGRYISPIRPSYLVDLSAGRWSVGGGSPQSGVRNSGSSVNNKPLPKMDATGGPEQVRVRYDVHLPSLSLRDGENSRSNLVGAFLPTPHSHVLCKNWHLCRVCWEDCERKKLHVSTPPEVATIISGLIKGAQEE